MGKLQYSDKQIESMIKGIEDGSIDAYNLPEDYYNAFSRYLKKAVYEGFGSTLETVTTLDLPMLEELLTNTYMFSAAKTFQQTQAISALLVDENGNVRSSREFNKLGRELYDTWNDNYGVTEYNTAIAQADAAVKWQEIERQKDIVPMLKYSAIGDACSICMPLDGLTAHVDSKIWDKIAPTNHFNCKCLLLQYDESEKATENPTEIVNPVVEKMKERGQDIFINNVGKTGEIFTSEHPYFDVAKEYRELAKQNFNLPLPKFQYATD
jgi:hypothetical protein